MASSAQTDSILGPRVVSLVFTLQNPHIITIGGSRFHQVQSQFSRKGSLMSGLAFTKPSISVHIFSIVAICNDLKGLVVFEEGFNCC